MLTEHALHLLGIETMQDEPHGRTGLGLILPTLLSWTHSALVLDIKGENHALTAGWRASRGQRILRFEPTAETGSIRFNSLAEVRTGTGRDIADCQNIASMIVDPEGKGLKDYWMQEGWSWLSVMILHVLYRIRKEDKRVANLCDVQAFASAAANDDGSDEGEHDRQDHGRSAQALPLRPPGGAGLGLRQPP
ncbi:type IV secretory system conjugative DNA transfer family protein [Rhodospirillum sp. A1_3_36]|uniref:type IV secretory system conjugative DNA transfer family protein n=1 Tax=Rhodospirillum sp. A1_3_36 TaxID=3391666 RepID=UPI0039A4BA07